MKPYPEALSNGRPVGAASAGCGAHSTPLLAAALAAFASLPGAESIAALDGGQLPLERMICTVAVLNETGIPC